MSTLKPHSHSRQESLIEPSGPQLAKNLEDCLCDKYPGEDLLVAVGEHARRFNADQQELRGLRRQAAGGCVFKRPRSPYWQLKYRGP
jgi:hypothetical protein